MGTTLLELDATGQLQALATRRVSAVELLEAAMSAERLTRERVNAVVQRDPERAVETARALDGLRARGEALGPLAGLPMTVKDTLDVEGMPASAGDPRLLHRSCDDAVVVSRARRAGAVIWGKTNTPFHGGDWQSFNRLHGTTNNPWDADLTPGGSSGGAAAAVATYVTPLEIGSDLAGSLRVPAAFCGIYAHQPTFGLVPFRGHVPPPPGTLAEQDLTVIGPMARSARDLRLLLSVLAPGSVTQKAEPAELMGLRIGLWLDDPLLIADTEVKTAIQVHLERAAAEGAHVDLLVAPVDSHELLDVYVGLMFPLLYARMPEGRQRLLDAVRPLARFAAMFDGSPLGVARLARAYTARHHEWIDADERRARLKHRVAALFEKHDVIVAPCAPTVAFPHAHGLTPGRRILCSDGRTVPYQAMLHWPALATVCGLPATAAPAGFGGGGLPVGLQIIGPRGADSRTLAVAQALEERLGAFSGPPTPWRAL